MSTSLQKRREDKDSRLIQQVGRSGSKSKLDQSYNILYAWDGFLGLSQFQWNLFFVFLVVFGMVGQNVSLPIWFASAPDGDLDPYFVLTFCGLSFCCIFGILTAIDICRGNTTISECLFFTTKSFILRCSLIGFCNALNGLFLVFAAPPNRTPTFLQAILGTFNIAWTLLFRAIILRKYPSSMQLVWAGGVFCGLFIASMPSIFGWSSGSSYSSGASGVWVFMWPIIFASSFAPAAVMNVVGENVLKETSESEINRDNLRINDDELLMEETNVNVWYYLTVQSITQFLTFICCFWVDAIPNFGTVSNIPDVWSSIKQDWRYFFAMDGASYDCTIRAMVFIICYTLNYIGSSLMLRYTEGATWTAIVGALVTPIGGIFWFFFEIDENNVFKPYWDWHWYDLCIIFGLFAMAPFIFQYDQEVTKQQEIEKDLAQFGINTTNKPVVYVNQQQQQKMVI